jgi:hypothetical protein
MDKEFAPERYFSEQGRDGKHRIFDRMRREPVYIPVCESDRPEDAALLLSALRIKQFHDSIQRGQHEV